MFKKKILEPIIVYFKQGLSIKKLSHSFALGIVIGIVPVIGISTILATFIGLRCKLFTPLILLLSYLVYPIQIILIIPFFKIGTFFLNSNTHSINVIDIFKQIYAHPLLTLPLFGSLIACAFLCWIVVSIPLYLSIYYTVLFFANKSKRSNIVN